MLNKSLVNLIDGQLGGHVLKVDLLKKHRFEDEDFEGSWVDYPDPYSDRVAGGWTLGDVWRATANGDSEKLDEITANDSDIREDAFWLLSDCTGLPYEFFYYVWLGNDLRAVKFLFDE